MRNSKLMKKAMACILVAGMAMGLCACAGKGNAGGSSDGLYASTHEVTDSPEWVKALESAQDANVKQLFVVAGMAEDRTTATVSMHERDKDGNWKQILSTPGYVGKNGLCADEAHAEGCAQTPMGVYKFNKAFGIADDPGCAIKYVK
ncbi:MAG: hypothetical protein K6F99_04235, partial [Lachnospiraceae bacterium]|nr:hypothetical protein [Lachnospiraceae bacterium]